MKIACIYERVRTLRARLRIGKRLIAAAGTAAVGLSLGIPSAPPALAMPEICAEVFVCENYTLCD